VQSVFVFPPLFLDLKECHFFYGAWPPSSRLHAKRRSLSAPCSPSITSRHSTRSPLCLSFSQEGPQLLSTGFPGQLGAGWSALGFTIRFHPSRRRKKNHLFPCFSSEPLDRHDALIESPPLFTPIQISTVVGPRDGCDRLTSIHTRPTSSRFLLSVCFSPPRGLTPQKVLGFPRRRFQRDELLYLPSFPPECRPFLFSDSLLPFRPERICIGNCQESPNQTKFAARSQSGPVRNSSDFRSRLSRCPFLNPPPTAGTIQLQRALKGGPLLALGPPPREKKISPHFYFYCLSTFLSREITREVCGYFVFPVSLSTSSSMFFFFFISVPLLSVTLPSPSPSHLPLRRVARERQYFLATAGHFHSPIPLPKLLY